MAQDRKQPPSESSVSTGGEPPIHTFLNGFQQLTDAFGRSIQVRLADAATRAIAEHLTTVVNAQANRLASLVLHTYDQATASKRAEVDQFLVQQAAVELARGAAAIAQNAASAPALKGISDIIEIIKKIIKFIFDNFFDKPPWLDGLLELIDEIIAALAGLFSFRLQRDINQTEIDYLRAMYHLRRLNLLEESGMEDTEER